MRKILLALPGALPDALIAGGCAAVAYGTGMLHPAAGFITGGVLAMVFGVLSARGTAK